MISALSGECLEDSCCQWSVLDKAFREGLFTRGDIWAETWVMERSRSCEGTGKGFQCWMESINVSPWEYTCKLEKQTRHRCDCGMLSEGMGQVSWRAAGLVSQGKKLGFSSECCWTLWSDFKLGCCVANYCSWRGWLGGDGAWGGWVSPAERLQGPGLER